MSDYKTRYSIASNTYIKKTVPENHLDQERYQRSKERERKWKKDWVKQSVALHEVVNKFIPTNDPNRHIKTNSGVKFSFYGTRYIVKADKVAGYLRIYDKQARKYCKIDGTPSNSLRLTHFKIKKRKEK